MIGQLNSQYGKVINLVQIDGCVEFGISLFSSVSSAYNKSTFYKDLPNSTEAGFSRKGYMSMIGKSLDPKKRTSIKNWFVMDLKRLHLLARIW